MGFNDLKMHEDKKSIVIEISVPSLNEDEIEVSLEGNMLQIKGKREIIKEAKADGFYAKEQKSGFFQQVLSFPVEVNAKKLKKEYKDGRLIIRILKKDYISIIFPFLPTLITLVFPIFSSIPSAS